MKAPPLGGFVLDEEQDPRYQRVLREFWSKLRSAGKKFPGARAAKLLWGCLRNPEEPWRRRALACSALLYFVLAIDAIPDPIPGGLMDDLVVMLLVVSVLALEDAVKGGER